MKNNEIFAVLLKACINHDIFCSGFRIVNCKSSCIFEGYTDYNLYQLFLCFNPSFNNNIQHFDFTDAWKHTTSTD